MRRWLLSFLLAAAVLLVLAGVAGGVVVYTGFVNIGATEPHTPESYYLMHYAMRRSVKVRAQDIRVPELDVPVRQVRGELLFRQHCQQCHGAPGVAPDPVGRGLRPWPTNLAQDGREWSAREIYWVVKHGIRMTAMPAWEYRLGDEQLWDLVAFVKHRLPYLTPEQYRQPPPAPPPRTQPAVPIVASAMAPNPETGRHLAEQFLCASCHEIPGITGADHTVGPPLGGIARRAFIAGVLPNTRQNMVRWLQHPQQIQPKAAMPDLGIDEAQARQIAAYLATLDNLHDLK